ncbi:MAG TPA: DUF2723 domain-containing protein [Gemmatimonadaceae bacterium]|nr:DUF2723 domain-containing protein [Gemmatimonadaceae bacterium]
MLSGGYIDLVRGGISLGPVLLVVAYGVLIPAAIWWGAPSSRPSDRGPDSGYRPSYRGAAVVAVGVFLLYLTTLAPSTAFWDASEYIAAAYTVGLPHPPGNPLFVLIGRVFSLLPLPGGVAVRINILAALSSAAAAGIWFLVTERATVGWLAARWQRRLTATIAALLGATAFTVWNQSVVNEKVYTVSLLGLAIVSWLAIRWCDETDPVRGDRLLLMIAYLCGLGYANHIAGLLPLPAVALAVLLHRPRTLVRLRVLLAGSGLLLLGSSPFATQPIRAAHAPPINEGEPTACREGLRFSCTFSRGTWDAFRFNLNREQYPVTAGLRLGPLDPGEARLSARQAPFTAQVGMWWLYFKWQWLRDVGGGHQRLQSALAGVLLVLGCLGGWAHWRAARRSFWYFATLLCTVTVVLIWYLNFRYGASQAPQLGDAVAREVRDRDYFYLWSFSAWGVWAAMGLVLTWEALASFLGRERLTSRLAWPRGLTLAAPVLALAFVPLVANWPVASRRGDRTTIAFARDLLNSVEPYGLLVTYGDNDTFPLWYAQEVEGVRRDVTVAVLSLLNTDWFVRSIIRRPVYEYDAARGPAVYRDRAWPKPHGPPVDLTIAQADSLPEVVVLREPVRFSKAGLAATIEPADLPPDGRGGGFLQRSDIVVLRAIADTWPERPVYFSRTTADYAYRLGLGEHLVSQGLARKLVPAAPSSSGDAVLLPGGGWFDLDRSLALWDDVFQGLEAIVDLGRWVDRPSLNVPYAYLFAGAELSEALRLRQRGEASAKVLDSVNRLARALGVEGVSR